MLLRSSLVAALLLVPTALQAQVSVGDIIPGYRPQAEAGRVRLFSDNACPSGPDGELVVCRRPLTDEGRRALHEFGSCLARRREADARASLLAAIEGNDYRSSLEDLVNNNRGCATGGALSFTAALLYGVIAEALFERTGPEPTLVARLARNPTRPSIQAADELDYLGLCTSLTAPGDVVGLLATRPASDEELQAFRALVPRVAPCVRAGEETPLRRPTLRSILAIAAFRLSMHNSADP